MPHQEVKDFPSVTTVLKVINKYEFPDERLLRWVTNNGYDKSQKIKKKSGKIGTRVHDEIQRLFEGRKPKSKNESVLKMVSNFNEQFVKPYQVRPLVIEPSEPLIDKEVGYSGTFDAIVEIYSQDTKSFAIADWKTSNFIDDRLWPLQLAAYAGLWNINKKDNDPEINEGFVIRLDKRSLNIEGPIWYANLDRYYAQFLACLTLYNYMKKRGAWKE